MKKSILQIAISVFILFWSTAALAQKKMERGNIIKEKMIEFIEQRGEFTAAQSKKFKPIFRDYFEEWENAIKQYRSDRLLLQQKSIELQLFYRNKLKEFLPIEKCNEVYDNQRIFLKQLKKIRKERRKPSKEMS